LSEGARISAAKAVVAVVVGTPNKDGCGIKAVVEEAVRANNKAAAQNFMVVDGWTGGGRSERESDVASERSTGEGSATFGLVVVGTNKASGGAINNNNEGRTISRKFNLAVRLQSARQSASSWNHWGSGFLRAGNDK
jgi:hypothetical protein